jgi:hypothetical protein
VKFGAAGQFVAASNDSVLQAFLFGLATSSINVGQGGEIVTQGEFDATTEEWDAVTGGSGGLATALRYFVGIDGTLTHTVPTSGILMEVGLAVSTTRMVVNVKPSIEL